MRPQHAPVLSLEWQLEQQRRRCLLACANVLPPHALPLRKPGSLTCRAQPATSSCAAPCHTCRKLFKLTKVFGGGAEPRELPLAVAEEGKAKVEAFQAYLPLIAAVCNPGLRERHWEALAELVGFTIKQDEVGAAAQRLNKLLYITHLGVWRHTGRH